MAVNKTTNYSLNKPDRGVRDWGDYLNQNMDTVDTELKRLTDKDADQDVQINNIVSNSGDSNTEIVDARLGADNVARNTLGELMREVHQEQVLANQDKKTLVHGLNIIESDQASPLKVEFYGNTLVNYLTNFNSGLWNLHGNITVIDDKTVELNNTSGSQNTSSSQEIKVSPSEQWLVGAITDSQYSKVNLVEYDSNGNMVAQNDFTQSGFQYKKVTINSSTSYVKLLFYNMSPNTGIFRFEDIRLYKLTSDQYNEIGVSLTDADVERLFPYVDSIKGVKNPVLSVSGQNLIPPFTEWDLHANATVISPYELELNATGSFQRSNYLFDVVEGQSYTFSIKNQTLGSYYYGEGYDKNGNNTGTIFTTNGYSGDQSRTFTIDTGVVSMKVNASNDNTTGTFTFTNPMLNLGSTALPFVEKNDSYLYAETTLYGNDVEKDILHEVDGQWQKVKKWESDVVLDGSLVWEFSADYTGFKRVRIVDFTSNYVGSHSTTSDFESIKYDGSIMLKANSNETSIIKANTVWFGNITGGSSSDIYITISDTDSGWTDAQTPSANMIKAYFNGWQYTGDGTTHSWVSIVDGSVAPTQTEDYVSTTQATGFKNYFLFYQRSESVVEPVTVEGDLSIQGDAQVELNVLAQLREVAKFEKYGNAYHINNPNLPNSYTNEKVSQFIALYENDKPFYKYIIRNDREIGEITIGESDFDTTATYKVTYIAKNDGQSTNLNEVKAEYDRTMKSSFNGVVAKQSDIATQTSINKNSIVEIYAILKENNLM